jgi:hypothetical protein
MTKQSSIGGSVSAMNDKAASATSITGPSGVPVEEVTLAELGMAATDLHRRITDHLARLTGTGSATEDDCATA